MQTKTARVMCSRKFPVIRIRRPQAELQAAARRKIGEAPSGLGYERVVSPAVQESATTAASITPSSSAMYLHFVI